MKKDGSLCQRKFLSHCRRQCLSKLTTSPRLNTARDPISYVKHFGVTLIISGALILPLCPATKAEDGWEPRTEKLQGLIKVRVLPKEKGKPRKKVFDYKLEGSDEVITLPKKIKGLPDLRPRDERHPVQQKLRNECDFWDPVIRVGGWILLTVWGAMKNGF